MFHIFISQSFFLFIFPSISLFFVVFVSCFFLNSSWWILTLIYSQNVLLFIYLSVFSLQYSLNFLHSMTLFSLYLSVCFSSSSSHTLILLFIICFVTGFNNPSRFISSSHVVHLLLYRIKLFFYRSIRLTGDLRALKSADNPGKKSGPDVK